MNTITFYLEKGNYEEVDFIGETLNFILQILKFELQKFKSDSYFVRGRHRSATKNFYGGITSKDSKVLVGYCSICNRKKTYDC